MRKSKIILTSIAISLCITTSILISIENNNLPIFGETNHNGYHYLRKDPTLTNSGYQEYWICCGCHEVFLNKPTGSFITKDESFMVGGIPDSTHKAYLPPKSKAYSFYDCDKYENFWETKNVHNEPICFLEHEDKSIYADLFYEPNEIYSIKNYALNLNYDLSDFIIEGKRIYLKNTSLPYVEYKYAFPKSVQDKMPGTNYDPLQLGDKYILYTENKVINDLTLEVSYTHNESWSYSKTTSQINKLPNLKNKLENKANINFVAYGDSISEGLWSSDYLGIDPHLPRFADGFKREMERRYGAMVTLNNTALRGMTSEWGKNNASEKVASYNPDLVWVAFGMNDMGSITKDTYKSNILSIIQTTRNVNPNAEFILCSSIAPNLLRNSSRLDEYKTALNEIASSNTGVAVLDMTSYSRALMDRKTSFDIFTNNYHHPNDFLVRGYVANFMKLIETTSSIIPEKDWSYKGIYNNSSMWKCLRYNSSRPTAKDMSSGVIISGMDAFDESMQLHSKIHFDGFSMHVAFDSLLYDKKSALGFFFTKDKYETGGVSSLNNIFNDFVFTFWDGLAKNASDGSSQIRMSVTSSHDYSKTPTAYSSANLTSKKGCHDAGPLILNALNDVTHNDYGALYFSFSSYNDDFYKITVGDLYGNTMKTDNYNYNSQSKSSFFYFPKSNATFLDANGDCYLTTFGLNGGGNISFANLTDITSR